MRASLALLSGFNSQQPEAAPPMSVLLTPGERGSAAWAAAQSDDRYWRQNAALERNQGLEQCLSGRSL
jgi:hypothetical protein